MFQSIRHSQLALRIGLAVVFIWYGVDKLIQPQYWLDSWVPGAIQSLVGGAGIGPTDFMHLIGIFEVLVALSLATGFFVRYFAAAGGMFLIAVLAINGFGNMALVPDIGLVGALLALVIWPERSYA